jgi:drug/metabolite transporter (DMT)-like permease
MWLELALLSTVFWAAARIIQKSLFTSDDADPITYAIYCQLGVALFLLPVIAFTGFHFPPIQTVWPWLLLTALFYSLGNILSFRALKTIPVSEFTILEATIPIWTALTSTIFLGESASIAKLLGVLFTVGGIIVAFYDKKRLTFSKAHIATLLSAVAFGCAFTNDAYLLQTFDATTYSLVYWLWPGVVLGLVYYKKLKGVGHFVKQGLWKFLAPSALFAAASLAINHSYKLGGEISQIATIVQFGTIVTIVMGSIFLKERTRLPQKLLGGIIVVLGVILVQMK